MAMKFPWQKSRLEQIATTTREIGGMAVKASSDAYEVERNRANTAEERLRRIQAEKEIERLGRRGNIFRRKKIDI